MEITAQHLAELTGGKIEGDGNRIIRSFAKIEEAGPDAVTFLANPKYTHYIYETNAAVVLVAENFQPERPVSSVLIRVTDPYATLAKLLEHVNAMKPKPIGVESPVYIAENVEIPEGAYIGAFAYIGKDVRLGRNVRIYPHVYIGNGSSIGDNTILYSGAKIYDSCVIGARCIIHSGAVIGADGFGFAPTDNGYEKIPQTGNVVLEDDTEVGANTTIDRATFGSTVIGSGTKLDNLVQIAHNVVIGNNNVFAAQSGVAGSTHIGNFNQIGGQVGFAGHIRIGNFNQFGAQSGVPNNVGDNNRLLGYPAVDARTFARNLVYIKKLDSLFNKNKK